MARAAMTRVAMIRRTMMLCGALTLPGACSSSPPPPPEHATAEEQAAPAAEPAAVHEAPQCVDAKDQKVQCLTDQDCCPRFVCGKDPDLSPSQTYCIFAG